MTARAFITGLAGRTLSADERAFLREAAPWGLILFARNVDRPDQVRRLVDEFRSAVGMQAPVLIDQEGGRVQRLGPPHWPHYPSAGTFGTLFGQDSDAGLRAAELGARLIAGDLHALGIDVDCLPVCDLRVDGADGVIGDRAYGADASCVARLARAAATGLMRGGVLPVVKHLPGHGRANADSHHALPVVAASRAELEATDFAAFRPLADLPLGMTAHVVFSAIDPVAPATTSAIMVGDVIRASIGFEGLLMSDDVSMGALSGSLAQRTRAVFAAGCDLALHCNGQMREMTEVAAECPELAGEAARRAGRALALRAAPDDVDVGDARRDLASLMRVIAPGTVLS